jgi:signal transduction histidine kinase
MARKIQAAAAIPLQFDGRLIGGLWVGRFEPKAFIRADLVSLESLADQIVIALQHALMASRLQSLAVLEERSRIAREMHDGLAQILGYLGLEMQTLEALVQQGNDERVLAELKQTRENIKVAQADVRENILSLRTTLSGEEGVLVALQEYITEFGLQTGKETELINEINEKLSLSPLTEVQLVRILQEALANVRKHAQAQRVIVILSLSNGCLHVTVSDDGIGFKPDIGRRQFGLKTMHERAESVGGDLQVYSSPQQGTKVELLLPLLQE